jgi:hypothetical protein
VWADVADVVDVAGARAGVADVAGVCAGVRAGVVGVVSFKALYFREAGIDIKNSRVLSVLLYKILFNGCRTSNCMSVFSGMFFMLS